MCDPPLVDDDSDGNEASVNDEPELSLQEDGKEVVT